MKKILMTAWLLGSLTLPALAEEEFRIFTSTDGRTIEAKILEYNGVKNQIRIERKGHGAIWISPTVFGAKDLAYINKWIDASAFMNESSLRVTLKKESGKSSGSKKKMKEMEEIYFSITFQNRLKKPIKDLKVECCYYITKEGSGKRKDVERVVHVNEKSISLNPSQKLDMNTTPQTLLTEYETVRESYIDSFGNTQYDYSTVKTTEDEFSGIWVRIYGPEVDGKRLYRDVTYPRDLADKVRWKVVTDG